MWVLLAALTAVSALHAPRSVVLGLNKYSHNACVAVADAHTGELLFAQEKERLTRVKNDGGAVGDLVRHALAACDVGIDDVVAVVANDHHRSVASEERAFARAAALGLSQSAAGVDVGDAVDPYNAFDATITSEMSHHLAHALGAAATGDRIGPGVVVVMDGMGEERRRFDEADFHSDADLPGFGDCVHVLNDARVDFGARWCLGVPGAFFGFGDWFAAPMDSLGAAYSHVSHVAFGDWNAGGKVMGLAPWGDPATTGDATWGGRTRDSWAPYARNAAAALTAAAGRGSTPAPPTLASPSTGRDGVADGDDGALVARCAAALAANDGAAGVVFWFEGRGEFGPRALGHRSIVAPATRYDVVDGINDVVKGREDFRPLAPAVLEEEASKWFAGKGGDEPTPYMSRVWTLARDRAELVPACAHVDDTARPQTVASTEPRLARYRALIAAVFALTGVPFALNTPLNTAGRTRRGEPRGAVSSFLAANARAAASPTRRLDLLLATPGKLRRARCPADEAAGSFPRAAVPARKHARYALTTTVERGDDGEPRETSTLRVLDLDEPLEDAARTRRGDVELLDALDAAIYERCDGELSAAELAADLVADLDEDESDPVSEADVCLRRAPLAAHAASS
ncbi:carbamoyltransferase [Aureococcus anophagefferens]|nr:carbamoyltransferase [Aureococcus anophagefferens]